MALIIGENEYITRAQYKITCDKITLGGKAFEITPQTSEDPKDAYDTFQALAKAELNPKIKQHIWFEHQDPHYCSKEEPIDRRINIKKLEKLMLGKEALPKRKYPMLAGNLATQYKRP